MAEKVCNINIIIKLILVTFPILSCLELKAGMQYCLERCHAAAGV